MHGKRQPEGNPEDKNDYFLRTLLYTVIGLLFRMRGGKLAGLALAGPAIEKIAGKTIEQALDEYLRRQEEREMLEIIRECIQKGLENWAKSFEATYQPIELTANVIELPPVNKIQIDEDHKWLEVIPHSSVVVIIGGRGSGKSALAYLLLELFRYRSLPFVLGIPQQGRELLPDWLGVINDPEEVPDGSTLLVDEAYLRYNARESQKSGNREISRIVNLSRQKQLTLIFVSQQASYLDKNLVGAADVIVAKEPSPFQAKFERHELNELIKTAADKFHLLSGDKKGWSLVYAPQANFFDMLPNGLPSFWNDNLSRVYASSGAMTETRLAKKMTRKEKIKRAKELNSMNVPISQIMKAIGVRSRTTVYHYLKTPDE